MPKGTIDLTEKICPVCGKEFITAPQHVYKTSSKGTPVCSYSCMMKYRKNKQITRKADAPMRELDELRDINDRISEYKLKKAELQAMVQPRAQTISDTPRGSNPINAIEEYCIRKEKIDEAIRKLEARKQEIWDGLTLDNVTDEERDVLRLRFYEGYSWKRCAREMKEKEQKLYHLYRGVLCKINKCQ